MIDGLMSSGARATGAERDCQAAPTVQQIAPDGREF
jgi:hypothetical protein